MNPSNLLGSYDFGVSVNNFRRDVLEGLQKQPKSLPSKYFYDEKGSQLFNRICETAEYYLTRCETQILTEHAADMLKLVPEPIHLIELGSIPMLPICADYTQLRSQPHQDNQETSQRLVYFPGSALGNLEEAEARALLLNIRLLVEAQGFLLIGIDLLKDPHILNAAYNDQQGLTAAFNLNLLQRMNRELGADFDLRSFQHKAFFHESESRVEMHLESLRDQMVLIADVPIFFRKGETIHTESSYKYDQDEFAQFCQRAGFAILQRWTDPQQFFAVVLLQAQASLH